MKTTMVRATIPEEFFIRLRYLWSQDNLVYSTAFEEYLGELLMASVANKENFDRYYISTR